MTDDIDQGGEAPCWAHVVDDLDRCAAPIEFLGSNTILYSDRWPELIDFYRTGLGLHTSMERDWFIEFELHPGAYLSVADSARASIASCAGDGLTLSWRVGDAAAIRDRLVRNGTDAEPMQKRWGADGFFVTDPAGNRLEFWSDDT